MASSEGTVLSAPYCTPRKITGYIYIYVYVCIYSLLQTFLTKEEIASLLFHKNSCHTDAFHGQHNMSLIVIFG